MIPFLRPVATALLGAMSLTVTLAALADSASTAPAMKMTTPSGYDKSWQLGEIELLK